MSARDTVICAVLTNTLLLALLLALSHRVDLEKEHEAIVASGEEVALVLEESPPEPVQESAPATPVRDEVDEALKLFLARQSEPPSTPPVVEEEEELDEDMYVQVVVKRGDALEKIARTNGTTVREIRKLNHLENDRIDVGQKLWVPKGQAIVQKAPPKKESQKGEYYTIQPGDNPWNLARKFGVPFAELLRLNQLEDEAKARKLQVGDRIRVR